MIVVVSNLLRAGSSMTMQMLHNGGYPCIGRWPSFEVAQQEGEQTWLRYCNGMAVKLLDPHRYRPLPGLEYRVIWIDRDVREQAKSTLKAKRALNATLVHRAMRADMQRIIHEQRQPALDAWREVGAHILMMRFERIIIDRVRGSRNSINQIADFVGGDLDRDAMFCTVEKRKPGCLAHMLEFEQIRIRNHA